MAKKPRPWTKEDVSMLKTLARENTTTAVAARKLKRTVRATYQKAVQLGVRLAGFQRKRSGQALAAAQKRTKGK